MRKERFLTAEELEDLNGLAADLRGLCKRWRKLIERLGQARSASVVKDRLLCVLHDCLSPALRDLAAIGAAARAPKEDGSRRQPLKGRRRDADSAATRPSK